MNTSLVLAPVSHVAVFSDEVDVLVFIHQIVNSDCVVMELAEGIHILSADYVGDLIHNGSLFYLGEL